MADKPYSEFGIPDSDDLIIKRVAHSKILCRTRRKGVKTILVLSTEMKK